MNNFMWGMAGGAIIFMAGFSLCLITVKAQEEEDYEEVDTTLDTAFSFLVLCHLQPDKVDHDDLEAFLIENNALEDY